MILYKISKLFITRIEIKDSSIIIKLKKNEFKNTIIS